MGTEIAAVGRSQGARPMRSHRSGGGAHRGEGSASAIERRRTSEAGR